MMEAPGNTPRPLIIPLTNEQKALASLERIEKLLETIVDNTRPSGTKALYTGKPYAGKK
jgi:hypothetical protein